MIKEYDDGTLRLHSRMVRTYVYNNILKFKTIVHAEVEFALAIATQAEQK